MTASWFEVDKDGLAALVARKGKAHVILELIQNAWDTQAQQVNLTIAPEGRGLARVTVEDDDPEGFQFLEHIFTLFARSTKLSDPELRGRFNMGDKLFLSLAKEARLTTTKGTVIFDAKGRTVRRGAGQEQGSKLTALLRLTREEVLEAETLVRQLIPPEGVVTTINGRRLIKRTPVGGLEASLDTEWADDEGTIRRGRRKTVVRVFEPGPGEDASIYEMGIPVVATGDRWHYDVGQRVVLNFERDNVTPAYLGRLRAAVVNTMAQRLVAEDVTRPWIHDALRRAEVEPEAVRLIVEKRFGKKAVVTDLSDLEANDRAVAAGYTVVHPRAFDREEWGTIRAAREELGGKFMRPAGQVTPGHRLNFSPDGKPLRYVPESEWSDSMRAAVVYAKEMGAHLLDEPVEVLIVRDPQIPMGAFFTDHEMTYNLGRLGRNWFESVTQEGIDGLLLHEFAHQRVKRHLTDEFADEIARLGARLRVLERANALPRWVATDTNPS